MRWLLFRAWLRSFSPRARALERQYGAVAGQLQDDALQIAKETLDGETAKLEELWPELGYRLDDRVLLGMQLPFLWGIFHEAVTNGPTLPTNGYDRITILMMTCLMKYRGLSPKDARVQALDADEQYHAGDELFRVLQERGKFAFQDKTVGHLAQAVRSMHEIGLKSGKIPL